jgi:hypothetical protein
MACLAYQSELHIPRLGSLCGQHGLLRLAAVAAVWVLGGVLSLQAQQVKPTEYQVKAAYLYNFGRFIDWPASAAPSDSFTICVLGKDPFGPALNAVLADAAIAGKSVLGKRISTPQEAKNCRVLFISSSEDNQLKQILGVLGDASILTVSDLPQFAQRGGMVQFILEGDKVRFEVNLATAERAGLSLSSQLLKVAVNVRKNAESRD